MKTASRGSFIVMALALLLCLPSLPLLAQNGAADNMQTVRDKVQRDKKSFVTEAMDLTQSETQGFWPVYESYQRDLFKLNDRTMMLVRNYARNYHSMTNEMAKKLTDEFLAVQAARQDLKTSYLPRFRKVLPDTKVARYYLLENQVSAVVNYELAAGIPLAK